MPQPHESVNKTVLRCLQKVSIVSSVLRRVTGRSFYACGPATANDLSLKVLLQHCMMQTDRSADLSDRLPDSPTNRQLSVRYAGAWPDNDRNARVASLYRTC